MQFDEVTVLLAEVVISLRSPSCHPSARQHQGASVLYSMIKSQGHFKNFMVQEEKAQTQKVSGAWTSTK